MRACDEFDQILVKCVFFVDSSWFVATGALSCTPDEIRRKCWLLSGSYMQTLFCLTISPLVLRLLSISADSMNATLLPPATKFGQGNIFRSVCQEFCSHPGAVHAGRYGQQAGGTHPTGMHTCMNNIFLTVVKIQTWFANFCVTKSNI